MLDLQVNVNLAPFTWWKVGGAADYLVRPKTVQEVEEALKWAKENKQPVTVLGGGSNVLISDQGVAGLVILSRYLSGVEARKENGRLKIAALAGTNKAEIAKVFLAHKLAPALFLCGLPGEVAGGVVMNAGIGELISPREFVEITDWVEVLQMDGADLSPSLNRFSKEELRWHYRGSEGWQKPGGVAIIVRVGLSWPLEPNLEMMNLVRQANKKRLSSQPLEWPSCGSTFRNPEQGKAGALIDQAGLKGYQIGGAQVSEKHANFIINRGGAKAQDILNLILHVQATVKKKWGVELQPEVKLIGRGFS